MGQVGDKSDYQGPVLKEEKHIDKVVELVDLMEQHNLTLKDIMDEWYLRGRKVV